MQFPPQTHAGPSLDPQPNAVGADVAGPQRYRHGWIPISPVDASKKKTGLEGHSTASLQKAAAKLGSKSNAAAELRRRNAMPKPGRTLAEASKANADARLAEHQKRLAAIDARAQAARSELARRNAAKTPHAVDATKMTADQKIAAYTRMHGHPPSAAAAAKLRGHQAPAAPVRAPAAPKMSAGVPSADARTMTAAQLITAYTRMHGKPPSAAQIAKLRRSHK